MLASALLPFFESSEIIDYPTDHAGVLVMAAPCAKIFQFIPAAVSPECEHATYHRVKVPSRAVHPTRNGIIT
jgi:hypothetical protein